MILFSVLLLSMFLTIAFIPVCNALSVRFRVMDIPDTRKIHGQPMPRSGGVAMALGILGPILFWVPSSTFVNATLAGVTVVLLMGLADDLWGLDYRTKFAGQTSAALFVVLFGGVKISSLGALLPNEMLLPDWLAIPLTVFVIVGVTNAINLSDGLDGLAGGISLLSFCCIGFLAYQAGNIVIMFICTAVAGSIFGFLRFNSYPATIFMGDAGSYLLGFLAITTVVSLTQENAPLSPLLPLIIIGFPILDTALVTTERLAKGKSPFHADKNHLHHKLIAMDLYHTEAVFVIYLFQTALIILAYTFRFYSDWWLVTLYLAYAGLVSSGLYYAHKTRWKFKRRTFLDNKIKKRLRWFKEKNVLVKVSFGAMESGIPLVLVVSCLLPAKIPGAFSLCSAILAGLILVTWYFKQEWLKGLLWIPIYFFLPFLFYIGENNTAGWMTVNLARFFNFSFGLLALFGILLVKSTRRKKGFHVSTMDYLIIFLAVVVANISNKFLPIESTRALIMVVKIMVLFYGYEVLIGELRDNMSRLGAMTALALVVAGARGIIG